ncbi:class I SAM-dependent methyltransferase [Lachnospiraceae bacterium 38-14]
MRKKKDKIDLVYKETREFFDGRAQKYNSVNPYGATMYQDNNSELVNRRNEAEVKRILPLLKIDTNSIVLDVACGVGRWADALKESGMKQYYGTDFSSKLIEIAKQRVQQSNCEFLVADVGETKEKLQRKAKDGIDCNRVILSGVLLYLNDKDIKSFFEDINELCTDNTRVYIRVPIGIEERLTLKDFYSDELETEYNAIYRTRDEYYEFMKDSLLNDGYVIETEGYIFEDDSLNNRQETRQYFFILSNEG